MRLPTFLFTLAAVIALTGHGHAHAATPRYCAIFRSLDHSCTSARVVVKLFGRSRAEHMARACGATDDDIAQANTCLASHGE